MATASEPHISPVEENRLTSSKTGTLYFAYGSNLSPSQMRLRCSGRPEQSAIPVAITRLNGYSWYITERGYANVKPVTPQTDKQQPVHSHESLSPHQYVSGVVYDMAPDDVTYLDGFEGCGPRMDPHPKENPDPVRRKRVPHLQRHRDYNKHYLPVTVVKWLVDPTQLGINNADVGDEIDVLVYVDEQRLEEGDIVPSYVGRMNRAINESAVIGMPLDWMESVMRKWVDPGVTLKRNSFIGDSEGYRDDWGEIKAAEVEHVA